MTPPAMVESPWCSPTCSVLLPIGIVLITLPLIWIVLGWLQMRFLKTYLKRLEKRQAYHELHTIPSPSGMKYGPWQRTAQCLLEDQKELVKSNSLNLGISLQFVLEELEALYREKAEEAEWRLDEWGPATKSGFLVKVRNCCLDVESGDVAWHDLPPWAFPFDPNFHQLAGLLTYGPHALGKGQICPRDGRADCSIVDALGAQPWPGMVARELTRYPVARLRMKNTSQCDGVSGKGFAGAACKMSAYGTAWRRQKEEAGAECRSHFLAMRQRVGLVVCSESCKGLGPWKADGIEREMRMAGSFLTHFWCSMSTLDARSSRPGKACSLLQTHSVVDLLNTFLVQHVYTRCAQLAAWQGLLSAADAFGRGFAGHGGRGSSVQFGAFFCFTAGYVVTMAFTTSLLATSEQF
eukprot:s7191_g1.t1